MPPGKRCGVHDGQCLPPVEPPPKPDEGQTGRVRRTPGFDIAFLVAAKLFAQKEVFCRESRRWAQAEPQEARGITQECPQETSKLPEVAEQARRSRHRQASF
jgi:hypothetical protein